MPISLEVWGEFACFSRPEMKVERVSYDMMTPSAARGLLEENGGHLARAIAAKEEKGNA